MITPDIPKNLTMSATTVIPKGNYNLGRLRPNAQGIYENVPAMYLNAISRSGEKYNADSFWRCADDPNAKFRMSINERGLFGENGHPPFYGIKGKTEKQLMDMGVIDRFMAIDENNVTHQIYDVRKGKTFADGIQAVVMDIKPVEPKGPVLQEELDDPTRNASFSVRQYSTKVRNPAGYLDAYCRALVTFDRVLIGGFKDACVAAADGLSQENLNIEDMILFDDQGKIVYDHLSIESFKNTALNDALQCHELTQVSIRRTMIDASERNRSKFPGLYMQSVFEEHLK